MKVVVIAAILGAAALFSPWVQQESGREKMDKDLMVVKASSVKWQKAEGMPEGVMVSHLTEPDAEPFVKMMKMPRGTSVPMHWHSANTILTVVSGTLVVGKEGRPGEGAGMDFGPGGYARISAKQPHWTHAKDDVVWVVAGDDESDIHWAEKEGKKAK